MKKIILFILAIIGSINVLAQNSNNKTITISSPKHSSGDSTFIAVEIPPEFMGGMYGLSHFLSANLVYPENALLNRISGRVTVQFAVRTDGLLSDFKIIDSPSDDLSKEAIRVLSRSPHWKPGVQNGKPVKVQFALPIKFTLPPTLQPIDTVGLSALVEVPPGFPGGVPAFEKFARKTMEYPADAKEKNIQGNVYVQFVVERTGDITGLHVERSDDPNLNAEAIRIMLLSPRWIPGKTGGKPVRAKLTIPITFTLKS